MSSSRLVRSLCGRSCAAPLRARFVAPAKPVVIPGLVAGGPFGSRRNFASMIQEGARFPDAKVFGGAPEPVLDLAKRFATGKTVIVGMPGAFTPTWDQKHVPAFVEAEAALKAKGVKEVLITAVNDAWVMEAWAKSISGCGMCAEGENKQFVSFVGDPQGLLTQALGVELTVEKACQLLGPGRCKRFALLVEDGVVKYFSLAHVSESMDDLAASMPDAILAKL